MARILVALALLVVAALSAATFAREASVGVAGSVVPVEAEQAVQLTGLPPSDRARQVVLDNCYLLLTSLYLKTLPEDRYGRVLAACSTLSSLITLETPTNGYAWLVKGLAGTAPDFSTALATSRSVSPNLGWLAQRRATLAEDRFAELTPAAREAQEADYRTMLASKSGVCTVAALYSSRADLRSRLKAIVETSSPEIQSAFLESAQSSTTC